MGESDYEPLGALGGGCGFCSSGLIAAWPGEKRYIA
jgi:hypothetical protein